MQKKSSILRGGKQSGAESMVTTPFHGGVVKGLCGVVKGLWLRDCVVWLRDCG